MSTTLRLALLAAVAALTQQAALAQSTTTTSLVLASDYKPRGMSQTHNKASLQVGLDHALDNGVYLGAWGYNIDWIKQSCVAVGSNCSRSLEVDLYAGYKGKLSESVAYDVGAIGYWYPGNRAVNAGLANANTIELYSGLTAGPWSGKLYYSATNYGGFVSSKGSLYLDLSAAFDLGNGFTLNTHLGHQWLPNNRTFNYSDYRVGVSKDLGDGFLASATLNGSNADKTPWTVNGRYWGANKVVIAVQKTF